MSGKEKTKGSLALAAPRVITIPANDPEISRKLRVAAYARVSSNSEDQAHSFAAQNAYFSKLIAGNPNWELADIYADKGITGTSIDKREDFLRMMEDCRKGRVDRILVKSISRFGRNTKESLEAVRELAGLGVSVLFEEQKIDTAAPARCLPPSSQRWRRRKANPSPRRCGGATGCGCGRERSCLPRCHTDTTSKINKSESVRRKLRP